MLVTQPPGEFQRRRRRFIRARRRQGVPRSKIAFIFMTETSHGGAPARSDS